MASLEDIRNERIAKLRQLKEAGKDPYPITSARDITISRARKQFSSLSESDETITIAGRIMSLRGQGGLVFCDLQDESGQLQVLLKRDDIDDREFTLFTETIDIGDIIEVSGTLFTTKREEQTVHASEWRILTKSLRPLPDKWHGLQDTEERFRKRYLDTLMNEEVRERFILRSRLVTELRRILESHEYLEVETPMLHSVAGGASAAPFETHHNALDMDLYLRIAPELYLKRLMIGGYGKIYELGRNFRNEGIDHMHNPEFTMLEFYESYSDAAHQRAFVEKMVRTVITALFDKETIMYNGSEIDVSRPFTVISFAELLQKNAGIADPINASRDDIAEKAEELGLPVKGSDTREKLMDDVYKKTCRPHIIQPTFVVDYPAALLPLAKQKPDNPEVVDAFQLVVGGIELVKAFSELNEPLEQKSRFEAQEEARTAGDEEAQETDWAFLEALEYGMPPLGGAGIGIDRLAMLLTDTQNIREVILFPTLREKDTDPGDKGFDV